MDRLGYSSFSPGPGRGGYQILMPVTALQWGTYLWLVDDWSRCPGSIEVPLVILTAILGIPFFVVIFKHNIRGDS